MDEQDQTQAQAQVTTLAPEREQASIDVALAFAAAHPEQNLREYLQAWMLSQFRDIGRSEFYGEATAICLLPAVLAVSRAALREQVVQAAFAADKAMFYESRDTGAVIDNPWITMGDHARSVALAERMRVIAVQAGGTGDETAPPEPLDFIKRHELAVEGRFLASKTLNERLEEVAYSSDAQNHVRLAFGCMEMEDAAIADGSYKSPEDILREIQLIAFNAREAAAAAGE